MNLSLTLKITILVLFISLKCLAQSGKISISKEPSWISKDNIEYDKTELDKYAENGYINISFEVQVSLSEQTEYFRSIRKIITQAGVQNGSEINISFDPLYEQLTFHFINIIRNGEIINKLSLSKIRTIHQESDLEKFIYNGALNALLILEDVRKGDIIEYSYSIRGFNPIFKGKYFREFSLQYSVPLYRLYYKIIVPQNRNIFIKNHDELVETDSSMVNGLNVYEWRKNNIQTLHFQDYTPSWYLFPRIEISEFTSWKAVNDWALRLFPSNITLSGKLKDKVKEIEVNYPNNQDRIKEALRFVQDEIRYMGIEMGVNSHKPADPSKVFSQRFGDCKEKSFLLISMLKEMKIEAFPVLINTVDRKNILKFLPSPMAFNHATVMVRSNDINYWFDPTISHQRGDIKKLHYPDYQAALILSDTTHFLTQLEYRDNSSVDVDESFFVSSMHASGTFIVTTTYKGSFADDIRYRFNNNSISELLKKYQKFYSYYYENIKADSLIYKEDFNNGAFVSIEYYTIPDFWSKDMAKGYAFDFSLFIIDNILTKPRDKDRKMPIEITFPTKYHEKVTINLPDDWSVTESEHHIKNSSFAFKSWFHCIDKQVIVEADYENLKNHVSVEEAPAYFKDLSKAEDACGYQLTSGFDFQVTEKQQVSTKNIIYVFLIVIGVIATFIWWSQQKKE